MGQGQRGAVLLCCRAAACVVRDAPAAQRRRPQRQQALSPSSLAHPSLSLAPDSLRMISGPGWRSSPSDTSRMSELAHLIEVGVRGEGGAWVC